MAEYAVAYIGSSVQEINPSDNAPLSNSLLERLKDLDLNRIGRNDDIVVRKAVNGLLALVAELERRVLVLEQSHGAH
jgi:hypothetical protein